MMKLLVVAFLGIFAAVLAEQARDQNCIEQYQEWKTPHAMVFQASGRKANDIRDVVAQFRQVLGVNRDSEGTFPSGRREIDWEAVPEQLSSPNLFTAEYFNVQTQRGVVFCNANPGEGFLVSQSLGDRRNRRFGDINRNLTNQFMTFSGERLFAAANSSVFSVDFFIPGTTKKAAVSGFGVTFTDVDAWGTTYMQFLDEECRDLGSFVVPPMSQGLSFLGVHWLGASVSRVLIHAGNAPLAAGINERTVTARGAAQTCPCTNQRILDQVAIDDMIYGEPQLIPEAALHGCPACQEVRQFQLRQTIGI